MAGECQDCGRRFEIEDWMALPELWSGAACELFLEPCGCGAWERLRFLCDRETDDALFVSICRACGKWSQRGRSARARMN